MTLCPDNSKSEVCNEEEKILQNVKTVNTQPKNIYILMVFIYEKALINMVSGDSSRELHTISSFTSNMGFASHYDCSS